MNQLLEKLNNLFFLLIDVTIVEREQIKLVVKEQFCEELDEQKLLTLTFEIDKRMKKVHQQNEILKSNFYFDQLDGDLDFMKESSVNLKT